MQDRNLQVRNLLWKSVKDKQIFFGIDAKYYHRKFFLCIILDFMARSR